MPTYTFKNILDAVKEEGRVDRSNDLDTMIKRIINEVMIKHSRNKSYPDLFVSGEVLAITTSAQSQFTLPVDYARVKAVRFSQDGTAFRTLRQTNQFGMPFLTGYPGWWYITGTKLNVYPYSLIANTVHVLQIDYYKVPALLVNDGDVLVVDDLYPVIINEALSRVRRYHQDEQGAQAFKKEAEESATTQQDDQ